MHGSVAPGAIAGLVVGGALSSSAVLTVMVGGQPVGWLGAVVAQPALVSVPAAFATMIGVSLLTQFAAGMWEFAKGNTLGATAFSSYGAFWVSFWWLTGHSGVDKIPAADAAKGIGLYLLVWGIFTAYMTVAASRVSGAVMAVFVLLTLTFLVLAWGEFATSDGIHKLGGYVGLLTALAAWYASFAGVTAFTYKRQLVPVGER